MKNIREHVPLAPRGALFWQFKIESDKQPSQSISISLNQTIK